MLAWLLDNANIGALDKSLHPSGLFPTLTENMEVEATWRSILVECTLLMRMEEMGPTASFSHPCAEPRVDLAGKAGRTSSAALCPHRR